MWATSLIFYKLLIVINRPFGENSHNLVTLIASFKVCTVTSCPGGVDHIVVSSPSAELRVVRSNPARV
jgi:hypothetical protein